MRMKVDFSLKKKEKEKKADILFNYINVDTLICLIFMTIYDSLCLLFPSTAELY